MNRRIAAAVLYLCFLLALVGVISSVPGPPPPPSEPPTAAENTGSTNAPPHRATRRPSAATPPEPDQPEQEAAFDGTKTKIDQPSRTAWPLDAPGIRGAVNEAVPELKACYEAALVDHPDAGGRIVMALVIEDVDGVGEVVSAEADEALGEVRSFEECALAALQDLEFDAPADGQLLIHYPVVFATSELAAPPSSP